jgi:hypothetical protein
MFFALFIMSPISVIAEYISDNVFPLLGRVLRRVFAQLARFGAWLGRFGAWLGRFEAWLEEPEEGHTPTVHQHQYQRQYRAHSHHDHKLKKD